MQNQIKDSTYNDKVVVAEAVLKRLEKAFDDFTKEIKKEVQGIHDDYVKRVDLDHKFEDIRTVIATVETKVDNGFRDINLRLTKTWQITKWLRDNALILSGIGLAILFIMDHIDFIKKYLP